MLRFSKPSNPRKGKEPYSEVLTLEDDPVTVRLKLNFTEEQSPDGFTFSLYIWEGDRTVLAVEDRGLKEYKALLLGSKDNHVGQVLEEGRLTIQAHILQEI
jgi:hypothetical protein